MKTFKWARFLIVFIVFAFCGCNPPDVKTTGKVTRVNMKNGSYFQACSFDVDGHRFISIEDCVLHHPDCECQK